MAAQFDWVAFLRQRRIEWIDEGPNVSKGNINVKCPFCGRRDKSYHMGLHPRKGWACWRDPTHRGGHPARLIAALARIPLSAAHALVSEGSGGANMQLAELRDKLRNLDSEAWQPSFEPIDFEDCFFEIRTTIPSYRRHFKYLRDKRGFGGDTRQLIERYYLHGALSDRYADRVIIPFLFRGMVIGWTARAITPAKIKYLSHPPETAGSFIYNYDNACEIGDTLVVVEGAVDVWKVDFYGHQHGIRAVGLLGLNMSARKLSLLHVLAEHYNRVLILLDAEAQARAVRLQSEMATLACPVELGALPERISDPGDLTPELVLPTVSKT